MNPKLDRLLDNLTNNINLQRQMEIDDLHRRALLWEPVKRLPLVLSYPLADDAPYKPYPHREIFDDPEKMLYNELVEAWRTHIAYHPQVDDDLPYTIRANFGTVIIASLFGGRVEQIADNPPWVRNFDTLDEFQAALERDPLEFSQGWCPRVIETYQFYGEVLTRYPELQQSIKIVLPDLQGPIDTAEQLRGSAFYLDLYDDPEMAKQAMGKIADAQIGLAKHLRPCLSNGLNGFSYQHGVMIRGNILIRDDSAIMVSPKMYRQQLATHDEKILREMDGGGLHSCGKIDHNVSEYLALPSIQCLDLGQAQMNDCERIYALARERKIPIVRMRVDVEELISGRVMERYPTGVSLIHDAESFADAQRIMRAYMGAVGGRIPIN